MHGVIGALKKEMQPKIENRARNLNDPVIPPRWRWLHNIYKVTVPLRCKPVCTFGTRRETALYTIVRTTCRARPHRTFIGM